MRILVAFEHSGIVRDAFRARGHDAWSCDLLPCDKGQNYHLQGDVSNLIRSKQVWDLIIMHPPCTALCVSGNRWYGRGMPKHEQRLASVRRTLLWWHTAISVAPAVAMENPVGVLPMRATQWIQPHQFGHPESKRTGLWLHGLPTLVPTDILPTPPSGRWENQTPSGQNRLGPSADRWKIRSKTYPGIAAAMADQWG